jgi:hypothetical protein
MIANTQSNLLNQYLNDNVSNLEDFLQIRKEFAYNYSTSAFLSYLLNSPMANEEIYLDLLTGESYVDNLNFDSVVNPNLNPNFIKLTRNLSSLFNPIIQNGIIAGSLVA